VIYLWYWYNRLKCLFGFHFWVGTLAGDNFDDPVDYYWCMNCHKEQKESPYKEDK
jgi:hypothetical protein